MRKILIKSFLLVLMMMLVEVPASAQITKTNIKGEVTDISGEILTISTKKGESLTVAAPPDFDLNSIQVGTTILVRADSGEGGTLQAATIMVISKARGQSQKDQYSNKEEKAKEGSIDHSAYCAEGKMEKLHPLAAKTAERYGVTEDWVMEHFCGGYSMGAIMLALKTSQIDGVNSDPAVLLTERSGGNAWGKIWIELGLIGSEKEGHSPPGQLKKQNEG